MVYEVRVQPHYDKTVDIIVRYGTRPHPKCPDPTWVHTRYFKGRVDETGYLYCFGEDELSTYFQIGEEIDAGYYGNISFWNSATNEFVIFATSLTIGKDYIKCRVYEEDEEYNEQFDPEDGDCEICLAELQEVDAG